MSMRKIISAVAMAVTFQITTPFTAGPAVVLADATAQPAAATDLKSTDGSLIFHLPGQWTQIKPLNPSIVLKADSDSGLTICVQTVLQADIVSFDAYAKDTHANNISVLKNVQASEPVKINVNGHPGIRYDYSYADDVHRWGRVELIVETGTRYNLVTIDSLKSQFDADKDDWAKLVDGLAELPATKK